MVEIMRLVMSSIRAIHPFWHSVGTLEIIITTPFIQQWIEGAYSVEYPGDMASPVWNSHAIRPIGIGGAAQLCSWVLAGSDDPADAILEVSALISVAAVSWGDSAAIRVDMPVAENAILFESSLGDGPRVVSWFARVALGWIAGPTDAVDLAGTWEASFDYPKRWAVETLQQLERDSMPLPGNRLEIRGSYPRDNIPLPCVSVQFEASPQAQKVLSNFARIVSAQRLEERIPWTVSLTLVLWAETPEDRDMLEPWFQNALQVLSHLAPSVNFSEPTFNLQESEDASGQLYEKMIFLVTGSLGGTIWSTLNLPTKNWVGKLTV